MSFARIISKLLTKQQSTKEITMTTETIEKEQEILTKIILPQKGMVKDKDGKSKWGYLPYEYPFQTKSEYFAWRKIWKDTYKELSLKIRNHKNERSNSFRKGEIDNGSNHAYEAIMGKATAWELLDILKEGKALSWKQKLSQKD